MDVSQAAEWEGKDYRPIIIRHGVIYHIYQQRLGEKGGGSSSDDIGIGIGMGKETGHLFVSIMPCHATPRQCAEPRRGVEMSWK